MKTENIFWRRISERSRQWESSAHFPTFSLSHFLVYLFLSALYILTLPGCGKVDVDDLVEKLASKDEDERSEAKDKLAKVGPEAVIRLVELIEEADLMGETEQCVAGVDILAVIGEKYADDLRAADITKVAKALTELITERGTDNQLRIKPKDEALISATINALGKYPDTATPELLIIALRPEGKPVLERSEGKDDDAAAEEKGMLWEKASKAIAQTGSVAAKPLVRALKEAEANLAKVQNLRKVTLSTAKAESKKDESEAEEKEKESGKKNKADEDSAAQTTPEEDLLAHIEDAMSKLSIRLVEHIVDKTKTLEFRLSAVEALAIVGGNKIPEITKVKALIPTMEDKAQDIRLRRGIAVVLAQLDIANIELIKGSLTKAMGDPDGVISLKAAEALCKAGNSAAINYLVKLLKDKDQSIRVPATNSLGIGELAARYIADKLKDEDKSVRCGVAQALGNIGKLYTDVGEENIVAPLLKVIEDIEADCRIAVVQALGKIASIKTLKPLIEALDDENELVRSYAKWGVQQIAQRERKEGLLESKAVSEMPKGDAAKQPEEESQWRSTYVVPVLNATLVMGREGQADTNTIVAAGSKVYAELGPGLKKEYYEKALASELKEQGKDVEVGKTFTVSYGGADLGEQRVGMIVSTPPKQEDAAPSAPSSGAEPHEGGTTKEEQPKDGPTSTQEEKEQKDVAQAASLRKESDKGKSEGKVMLGIEVAQELTSSHEARLTAYMKLAGMSDGLLMNFGSESFESKTAGASGVAIGPEYLYMAADLLAKVGDESSIKPLITILTSKPDLDEASPQLRERSAYALGEIIARISNERSSRGLSEDFPNRVEGIECLKNVLKELKPETDAEAARKTACTKTREQAAISLGKIGDAAFGELLTDALASDDDASVRIAASLALSRLATSAARSKRLAAQSKKQTERIDQATLAELFAATPITKQLKNEDTEVKEAAEDVYERVTGKDPEEIENEKHALERSEGTGKREDEKEGE